MLRPSSGHPDTQSAGRNLTWCFLPLPALNPPRFVQNKPCLLPSLTAGALTLRLWRWIESRALRKLFQGTVKILLVGV